VLLHSDWGSHLFAELLLSVLNALHDFAIFVITVENIIFVLGLDNGAILGMSVMTSVFHLNEFNFIWVHFWSWWVFFAVWAFTLINLSKKCWLNVRVNLFFFFLKFLDFTLNLGNLFGKDLGLVLLFGKALSFCSVLGCWFGQCLVLSNWGG